MAEENGSAEGQPAGYAELPIAFTTFAASLRPQVLERSAPPQATATQPVAAAGRRVLPNRSSRAPSRHVTLAADPLGTPKRMSAADPDLIWTKHIGRVHGTEKHTPSEWRMLIDRYRHQPAYPGDSR